MAERLITCRYLDRNGNQCTGEATNADADVLLCSRHLAGALSELRANPTLRALLAINDDPRRPPTALRPEPPRRA